MSMRFPANKLHSDARWLATVSSMHFYTWYLMPNESGFRNIHFVEKWKINQFRHFHFCIILIVITIPTVQMIFATEKMKNFPCFVYLRINYVNCEWDVVFSLAITCNRPFSKKTPKWNDAKTERKMNANPRICLMCQWTKIDSILYPNSKWNCSFAIIYGYYDEFFFCLCLVCSVWIRIEICFCITLMHSQKNSSSVQQQQFRTVFIRDRVGDQKCRLAQIGNLDFDTEIVSVNCKRSLFPFYFCLCWLLIFPSISHNCEINVDHQ